jgi:DNA-binding transcriptional LysR family regulator
VQPRVTVDSPATVLEMVRRGVGLGVLNAVALARADTTGLAVLDIGEPGIVREVAAYWYEVLVTTEVGTLLHRTVLETPIPPGAEPVEPPSGSGRPARDARDR